MVNYLIQGQSQWVRSWTRWVKTVCSRDVHAVQEIYPILSQTVNANAALKEALD